MYQIGGDIVTKAQSAKVTILTYRGYRPIYCINTVQVAILTTNLK